jgi:hypothetical protein
MSGFEPAKPEEFSLRCCAPAGRSDGHPGPHKTLSKEGSPNVIFAFHDDEELGPRMLARIAKETGLKPEDL